MEKEIYEQHKVLLETMMGRVSDEFIGFVCGIISQDRDLEKMYLDSFLTISGLEGEADILPAIEKLDKISEAYHVDFVLSVSKDENELPDSLKSKIIVSL